MTVLVADKAAAVAAPAPRRRLGRRRSGSLGGRIGIQTALWIYALYTLMPLLIMVSDSLRTQQQMVKQPLGLPTSPNWAAYSQAWVQGSFGTYIKNSIVITVSSVLLSTVCSLLGTRTVLRSLSGQGPGAESSVAKLLGVKSRQDASELVVDMLGELMVLGRPEHARSLHESLLTRCLSIAGGTTQVLRNVAGERILGLPR